MALVVPNFVKTALRAACSPSDTVLFLTPGTGILFDAIGAGDWCYVTVNDSTTVEVMRYDSVGPTSNDSIPVVRAQDNTTAKAFPVGSCVAIGWNVGQITALVDQEIVLNGRPGPTGPSGPTGPTGATGPEQMPTPYDFGAVGDGVTDDTVAMQAWLDAIEGGAGYGKAGTFICSAPIFINSNTTIYGAGQGSFFIKTKQSVPQDFYLFSNRHQVTPPNSARVDTNIQIYGVCFEGDPVTPTVVPTFDFVDFIGVDNLTIRDCRFQHRRSDLLVLSNNTNLTVDNCDYTDHDGVAIFCLTANYNVKIINNRVNGGGGGIWVPVENSAVPGDFGSFCVVTGNIITGVQEFGLVAGPPFCVISNNVIFDVTRNAVSGHGMELHGQHLTVTGNSVDLCDGNCIDASNVAWSTFANNDLARPGQQVGDPNTSPPFQITGRITGLAIVDRGTSFVLGQTGVITQAGSDDNATYTVTGLAAAGGLYSVQITFGGTGYSNGAATFVSDAAGTGATCTLAICNQYSAGLLIRSFALSAGEGYPPSHNLTIADNMFRSDGPIQPHAAITFVNATGDSSGKMYAIDCHGNNFGNDVDQDWFGGIPIVYYPDADSVVGPGSPNLTHFVTRNNLGALDMDPVSVQFVISGTGDISVTGVGFRPRRIEFRATKEGSGSTQAVSIGYAGFTNNFPNSTGFPTMVSSATAWSADGTDSWCKSFSGTACVALLSSDGSTVLCQSSITTLDNDGFTINTATWTTGTIVDALCYP